MEKSEVGEFRQESVGMFWKLETILNNRFHCLNNTIRISTIFFYLYIFSQHLNNITKTTGLRYF